jgi:very-short-patch-repair endonuclease
MPRFLNRYRYRPETEDLLKRRKKRSTLGYKNWQDPIPNVLGTVPEKKVYAELIRRQIPFMFQTYLQINLPAFNFNDWYRPDFILPHHKIIIEVQGAYWHSKPEQVEKDAFKYALYQYSGYKVLTWWDFEIDSNLFMLFAKEPSLGFNGAIRGGRIITENQEIIDDAKGIRTGNTKRANYGAPKRTSIYSKRKTSTRRSFTLGA